MARLRQAKKRMALLIAVADLAAAWTVEQVTSALTAFADATLGAAITWLLADYARAGKVTLADAADPQSRCGYVALAMGKQGAD
jgi:glutamate-ammonia-ligase adenylyltransferase